MELDEIKIQYLQDLGIKIESITDKESAAAARSAFLDSTVGGVKASYELQINELKESHSKDVSGSSKITESQKIELAEFKKSQMIDREANKNGASLKELQLMKSVIGSRFQVNSSGNIVTVGVIPNMDFSFMGSPVYSVASLLKEIRSTFKSSDDGNGVQSNKATKVSGADDISKYFAKEKSRNKF